MCILRDQYVVIKCNTADFQLPKMLSTHIRLVKSRQMEMNKKLCKTLKIRYQHQTKQKNI